MCASHQISVFLLHVVNLNRTQHTFNVRHVFYDNNSDSIITKIIIMIVILIIIFVLIGSDDMEPSKSLFNFSDFHSKVFYIILPEMQ